VTRRCHNQHQAASNWWQEYEFGLSLGIAKDSVNVSIESHAPKPHVGHQLLSGVEFTVATEHALNESDARVGTQSLGVLLASLGLSFTVHESFTTLE
jgi:hypothetical protein